MARGRRKNPQAKKVAYELLAATSEVGKPIYTLLKQLVKEHHEELADARIGLAWCKTWKADTDGRLKLGQCRKASDLDRELHDFDYLILLNKVWWYGAGVEARHHAALIDHELCHAAPRLDKFLEPVLDERGRKTWRIRRHDIEEFAAIPRRHGLYKRDLQDFAEALKRGEKQGTFDVKTPKGPKSAPAAEREPAAAATH